ncbi:hypothetical protein MEX01_48380 [Methylorubrum extorquens]|uniref:hypothetical protein n=1 Tax=Methylorubrum extorquens TaxID=408 RepID=UPI001173B5B8|nr:hypothetical protein [Methylorubrum extorquens]GEL44247.1 hypothetical protein MEX01_48380 [Methylorubrum extorquens]
MKLSRVALVAFVGAFAGLMATFAPARQYRNSEGNTVSQGVVIEANDQAVSLINPIGVMQMPFVRSGTGDPIIFSGITTTAKQFEISKPADATAYRFVNPCNVDVRIRKVGSLSESVTPTTGTRFMARSSEVLGTSEPRFVSLIAMAAPTGDCTVELQYGRGS